jgi:putative nucleotidyltransferase with HDIG domain
VSSAGPPSDTPPPGAPPAAAPEGRIAAEMEKIVTKRIASDQLVLPAIPAVALKCLQLIKNPDFSLKDAASIIERDPILTARIVRLANSAGMATRDPAQSVLAAVTRLGLQKLRTFLVESSARKVFESRDPRIVEASRKVWEHSLAVALLARDVVAFSNAGPPDFGYLGGLLHDVGKPVVAAMLLEAEKAILGAKATATWIGSTEWIGVIQRVHRQVGVALAEKWELPDPVLRGIRDCQEYDNADRLSIANAVRFANALAKQQGIYEGTIVPDDNDALLMVGRSLLGLDEETVTRLTTGLRDNVKEQLS